MPALDDLRNFDVAEAEVTLWVFKKSYLHGSPRFKGRWVETSEGLDEVLKQTVISERDRIEEVIEYGLLAQNNEASALSISSDETYAGLIVAEAANDTQHNRVTQLRDIRNTDLYAIKLVRGESVIYGIKKADASWKTKKVRDLVSVIFADERLGLEEAPSFDIANNIDFVIVGETLLIFQKAKFESIMNYKEAHKEDFVSLIAEPEFVAVIADMNPIIAFVGDNKIQLRRASAIRQKAHYANPVFMQNLRAQSQGLGFNFQFDGSGSIIVTTENCRELFQALLDHRLLSLLSDGIYDVQDAVTVNV